MNMYESIKESYNYIGLDTGEQGRDGRSHIEHIFTVYDQYGEVETFKTEREAQQYIDDHKDDTFWQDEGMEQPEYRIEEDDIEVMNEKITIQDDLQEADNNLASLSEGIAKYIISVVQKDNDLTNKGVKINTTIQDNKIEVATYQDGKPINVQLINIDEIKRSIK